MMMSEEDAGKESVRRATAGREAWAAAVDPWRRVFSSKIPSVDALLHLLHVLDDEGPPEIQATTSARTR